MRNYVYIFILSFFVLSGIFLSGASYAEENLRNYPAYVIVEDFNILDKSAEQAGANIIIQKGFCLKLPAFLPKAKIVSVALDYGPEMSEGKKKLKKYREENDRRLKEGLPLISWESIIPPGEYERFKPLIMGDFLITGMLSKAAGKYYVVVKVITTASKYVGFRTVVEFGNITELASVVDKISAQVADALKDSFYCVDTDPAELRLSGNKTAAALTARVVNLMNEPVDGEPLKFEPAKRECGEMQPDKAPLNKGIAKSKYVVKQRKPNLVKVFIKPKGRCGKGIVNGLRAPVKFGIELKFEGDANAKAEIKEEEASFDLSYKTHYSDGWAFLEVDEKSGIITGTGYCYRKNDFGGTFAGDGVSGGQEGASVKERIEVTVRGAVKDNAVEFYIKFMPGNLQAQNRIWATSESGASQVDINISKDTAGGAVISAETPVGQLISSLEGEKEFEIGPVKIQLTEGKHVEFEFTPPSPIPGISQQCRFIFKIVSERISQ